MVGLNIGWSDSFHFFILLQFFFQLSRVFTFHINFGISSSIPTKLLLRIFKGIGLNIQINLERADFFMMLSLPIHEHVMSTHLFMSTLIFSAGFYILSILIIGMFYFKCIPKLFIFIGVIVNDYVFLILVSLCSLLVYRSKIDYLVLLLCFVTLLNSLISSRSFL